MKIIATMVLSLLFTAGLWAQLSFEDVARMADDEIAKKDFVERLSAEGFESEINAALLVRMGREDIPEWMIDELMAWDESRYEVEEPTFRDQGPIIPYRLRRPHYYAADISFYYPGIGYVPWWGCTYPFVYYASYWDWGWYGPRYGFYGPYGYHGYYGPNTQYPRGYGRPYVGTHVGTAKPRGSSGEVDRSGRSSSGNRVITSRGGSSGPSTTRSTRSSSGRGGHSGKAVRRD